MLLLLRIILNWHRPDKDHASLSILRQFAQSCFHRIVWQNPCQFARILRKISCHIVGKISCHIAVQQMVQCSKWCGAAKIGSVADWPQCCRLATVWQKCRSRFVPVLFHPPLSFCSRFVPILFLICFHARLLRKIVARMRCFTQHCCAPSLFHAILLLTVRGPVDTHVQKRCIKTMYKTDV